MSMKWVVGLILTATTLCACSAAVDVGQASQAVAEFRRLQAAGSDEALYSNASPVFRNSATFADFKRIEDAVRAAIARGCEAPPADAMSWNTFYGTGGERVTMVYRRNCADGDLTETFVFVMDRGTLKLGGYQVGGMALFPPSASSTPPAGAQTTTTTPAPSATPAPK
ncbi:MAG: hypothetical protein JSS00_13515 [Proteobacteria bacterium]|nr:hypothetical protein [Pseudomonadota bacterium]